MTTPMSSRQWLDETLTDCIWISHRKFVLFVTNGSPLENPVVSESIWDSKWLYSAWERKRLNGTTREPELLLQYQDLRSAKLVYELVSHWCLFFENATGERIRGGQFGKSLE